MRLSATILPLAAFVIAAAISVATAMTAVAVVEDRSVSAVRRELHLQGNDWASVLGDGLQIVIEGQAPSEAARFRAMSVAGGVVDASRVIDNMSVLDARPATPPDFAIEILRNDRGVSLIGLVPAATDRADIAAQVAAMAGDLPVTDLLEIADHPVPQGWNAALRLSLQALAQLPRSKVSVAPGRVGIEAISDSTEQKSRLEAALARMAPENVALDIAISAPRPVITPFTTRFVLDGAGARFEACSADTEDSQRLILAAAARAGLETAASCTLGLGVPTRSWGEANARAIDALAALGGGTLTFSDADVILVAPEGTPQDDFDRIVGELDNALPDVFALQAVLPQSPETTAEGPPQFSAFLSPDGQVQVRGRVPDDLMNETVANFAYARFGREDVTMGTRTAEGLPAGWSVRILAALEALSTLSNGSVVVQPDRVAVRGNTGDPEASARIARLMIEKLGQQAEFSVDVAYVAELDPLAGLPTPEECIGQIVAITEDRKITFEPGSATLDSGSSAVVDEIAELLRRCLDLPVRIAGYTDSQGREEMNLRLSQERADAVLTALRARRVPTSTFTAVGYGIADPIADNGTEAGREANRRIEFSLIAQEDPASLDEVLEDGNAADPADAEGSGDADEAD